MRLNTLQALNYVRAMIEKKNFFPFALQTTAGYRIMAWAMREEETDEYSYFDAVLPKIGDISFLSQFGHGEQHWRKKN